MGLRDELIAAMEQTAAIKPKTVHVKGWPELYVREVTVAEVDAQTEDTADKKDKNRIARAAARVICDKDGNRIFNPDNDDDVALLAKQPWSLLRKAIADGTEEGN